MPEPLDPRNKPTDVKVHVTSGSGVDVVWGDGHSSHYEFAFLRDECPCATCNDRRQKEASMKAPGAAAGGLIGAVATHWIQILTVATIPIVSVARFFEGPIKAAIEASNTAVRWRTWIVGLAARLMLGLLLPALLWIAYLYLCFWGIADRQPTLTSSGSADALVSHAPG